MTKNTKIIIICLLASLCAVCLVACSPSLSLTVNLSGKSGKIGNFELLTPTDEQSVTYLPTFSWQAAENADTYTIELCSDEQFSQKDSATYVKKTGVTSTNFTFSCNLQQKDVAYYWRVTAQNSEGNKLAKSGSFYFASIKGEVAFPIEYAEDWSVHKEGSQATLSINRDDFFGNGKPSLGISFTSQDTKRGNELSDGWVVVTQSKEVDLYGVNAFYFNFYYSGDDAEVYFRVMDNDNEYWHAPVKVAKNAKQTVIVKFSDFELRTKSGTTIANREFDYNHIRYVELVYEKAFGDGVTYISDIRAIDFNDYSDLFLSVFDFDQLSGEYAFDSYDFDVWTAQSTIRLTFGKDINKVGYGFVRIPVGKLLAGGDAFAFSVDASKLSSSSNVLVRVVEEDGDRWMYKQSAQTIAATEGKIIVPFKAFTLSEANGDGARQFSYLAQLQLGVNYVYSAGEVTISDIQVVTLADVVDDLYQGKVDENGVVDDFSDYACAAEVYRVWQNSVENKDEAMALGSTYAASGNGQYLELAYKTDMYPAVYGVTFNSVGGFDALSIDLKDMSVRSSEPIFDYLSSVSPYCKITVYVRREAETETFGYNPGQISADWTRYKISFADFVRDEGFYGELMPFTSQDVVGVSVQFWYFYLTESGKASPQYRSSQKVLADNVAFAVGQTEIAPLAHKLKPSETNPNECVVDDGITSDWLDFGKQDYASLSKTYSGTKMAYKGNAASVSYRLNCQFDSSVDFARAVVLDVDGDGKATMYVNIIMLSGDTTYKLRAQVKLNAGSHRYTIGFNNFVQVEPLGGAQIILSKRSVDKIIAISIGLVNYSDNEPSSVVMQRIILSGEPLYTDNTVTAL